MCSMYDGLEQSVCEGEDVIPSIDFSAAEGSKEERIQLASDIVKALQDVGFLYLDNVKNIDPMELRKAIEWFFYSLPPEERLKVTKKQWNPNGTNVYRGFFPAQGAVSHKESLEIGKEMAPDHPDVRKYVLYEPNLWPNEDGQNGKYPAFPGFRAMVTKYYDSISKVALDIIRLISIGLGLEENYFEELFRPNPLSTLRFLHYPPRNEPPPPDALVDGVLLQCEAHSDTPILTLLGTFEFRGLQILSKDGEWISVEPKQHSLIMNVGDTLVQMTKGHLKATVHRVAVQDPEKGRFSVPFFLEPDYRANIGKFLNNDEVKEKALNYYGPWVIHEMAIVKKYVEQKDADWGNYMEIDFD